MTPFSEIQASVRQRLIDKLMGEGLTEQEAVDRYDAAMAAPWPETWPPLPTMEELDAMPEMTPEEAADLDVRIGQELAKPLR